MKRHVIAALIAGLAAGGAQAGEVQRDSDRSMILFEDGENYFEFTFTAVKPDLSGTLPIVGLSSGNIGDKYQNVAIGYKRQINDRLAFAITANEPYGADVTYVGGTLYPFSGSTAELNTLAITGLLKYNLTDRISAYGGLRLQSMDGTLTILTAGLPPPIPAFYALRVDNNYQLGYVLGGAYEIKKLAMRVALTYESEIEHEFSDNTGAPFKVKIPQAVTLHAQSGVAPRTLVFGSIRWQEWTDFRIAPLDFAGGLVPIASGPSDIWTYELGVGHRFSDAWSGALTIGYEPDQGDIVGNLSGKDGFVSYGIAVKYETEAWEITTGLRYIDIGSAITTIGSNFSGNHALAAGFKVGFRF
ncbi:MAG: outer membrane protein transport protein [Roseovarius sp.]